MKLLIKETFVTIKKSYKRFISILLIVLLGVGFFAGIKATSPDMELTINKYYNDTNFMDINLLSTWGITDDDINKLKSNDYDIEGSYSFDSIVKTDNDEVVKVLSYDKNSKINKIILLEGKLPENDDECVIETTTFASFHNIGDKLVVDSNNLKNKELTIVGIVKTPIYISLERGTTKLSSGKINYFIYTNVNNFNMDYYTEANIKLDLDNMFDGKYDKKVDKEKNKLKTLTDTLSLDRYNSEKNKALDEYNSNKRKYEDEKKKTNKEINDAKNKVKELKSTYNNGVSSLNDAKKKAINEYNNNKKDLNNKLNVVNSSIKKINDTKIELNNKIKTIDTSINSGLLDSNKILELEYTKNEINKNITSLNNTLNTLNKNKADINNGLKTLEKTYNSYLNTFSNKQIELNNLKNTINNLEKTISNNEKKANDEFLKAEEELKNAKDKIDEIEKPTWYILDRNENIGYYQFSQDIDRIRNLGTIFPLVFYVVAILICLTSMTRMVEEERGQLGTLKSLGFNSRQIIFKYILYALLATIVGSIIGLVLGFNILPDVIFNMYSMMYNVGRVVIDYNVKYALIATLIAVFCTLFATIIVCVKSLKEAPSELLRPKTIKSGKKILLERINFIWKRLRFNRKITFRNVFRYKKRMIMTIVGVAGCTGLIIAGYGLKDCITGMVSNQYGKIFDYQLEITLEDDTDSNEILKKVKELEEVNDAIRINKETIELMNIKTNQTIQLIVPDGDIENFIHLRNRVSDEKYELKDKVIISEKLSTLLNINRNDTLEIDANKDYKVKVGDITENYLYHFIYMSNDLYKDSTYNTILVKTDKMDSNHEKAFSNKINEIDGISGLSFTSSMSNIFDSTMKNFEYVVVVLIVSANLLAFVVLYNLASVNISERKRELATIKVLGFYDKEVYDYIGRETTILTLISIVFGLFMGRILTTFIIKTCELDMIMFNPKISTSSYIYGVLITILFTIVVNITTYFSLKKIEMIESLKSVE